MIVRLLIYLFESAFRNYMIDFFLLLMHVSSKAYWTLTPKIWNFCVWKTLLWEVKFFFVMMKMKFFVVEFKKQTWIFILFFVLLRWQTPLQIQIRMASLGKCVFVPRGKSNASFMAIFACFVLFLCVLWPFLYGCTF